MTLKRLPTRGSSAAQLAARVALDRRIRSRAKAGPVQGGKRASGGHREESRERDRRARDHVGVTAVVADRGAAEAQSAAGGEVDHPDAEQLLADRLTRRAAFQIAEVRDPYGDVEQKCKATGAEMYRGRPPGVRRLEEPLSEDKT